MNIIKNNNFKTHNSSKRTGAIKYIVIHYVGATGDAKDNVNFYNRLTTTGASADFFVGHNGDVYQYNPDIKARYTWAVGGKKQSSYGGSLYGVAKNNNTVNIEMCVKTKGNKTVNSPDWYFTEETVNATIELVKYLMSELNISADNVIRHYDVNGKYCPGVVGWNAPSGSETAWENFKAKLTGSTAQTDESFKVQVSISNLNIRKGSGTNYALNGVIKPGIYTIVDVKSGVGSVAGWGKLKSGVGWISLDYAKRL